MTNTIKKKKKQVLRKILLKNQDQTKEKRKEDH